MAEDSLDLMENGLQITDRQSVSQNGLKPPMPTNSRNLNMLRHLSSDRKQNSVMQQQRSSTQLSANPSHRNMWENQRVTLSRKSTMAKPNTYLNPF